MEPKDFKDLLETVYSTPNDNGELSKLLTKIYDAFDAKHLATLEAAKQVEEIAATNATLVDVNEKLRGVNMDLFLKIGSIKKESQAPDTETTEKITPITEVYS